MMNRGFYNEILTEHNIRPEFKHDLEDANIVLEGVILTVVMIYGLSLRLKTVLLRTELLLEMAVLYPRHRLILCLG